MTGHDVMCLEVLAYYVRQFPRLLGTACFQWCWLSVRTLCRGTYFRGRLVLSYFCGRSGTVLWMAGLMMSVWECGPDQLVVWELERSQPGGSRAPARCWKVLQCPTDSRAKNLRVSYHGRILAVVEPSAETQSLGARQPPVKNIPSRAAVYMRGVFIIWGVGGVIVFKGGNPAPACQVRKYHAASTHHKELISCKYMMRVIDEPLTPLGKGPRV